MSFGTKVHNFLRRAFIYQYLAFWVYIRYNNLQVYGNELKDKINTNLAYLEFENEQVKSYLETPEQVLYYILILEAVLIGLALFGTRLAAFFLGSLTALTTFIYYNPLLKENRIQSYYGIKTELILSIGVILAVFLDQFYSESSDSTVDNFEEEIVEEVKNKPIKKEKGKKNK
jgi:uncharacterized membrane protein YphA (DoxX/SURF4 family)